MGQWRQAHSGLQRFPRVPTAVAVRVTTVEPETDPDTGKAFFRSAEETTANLSHGGAYLRSWEPLAPGRRVVITIALPRSEELQLVGRVAWTRRALLPNGASEIEAPGYGIEFIGGSSTELAALDHYLTSLEPRFTTPPTAHSHRNIPQP